MRGRTPLVGRVHPAARLIRGGGARANPNPNPNPDTGGFGSRGRVETGRTIRAGFAPRAAGEPPRVNPHPGRVQPDPPPPPTGGWRAPVGPLGATGRTALEPLCVVSSAAALLPATCAPTKTIDICFRLAAAGGPQFRQQGRVSSRRLQRVSSTVKAPPCLARRGGSGLGSGLGSGVNRGFSECLAERRQPRVARGRADYGFTLNLNPNRVKAAACHARRGGLATPELTRGGLAPAGRGWTQVGSASGHPRVANAGERGAVHREQPQGRAQDFL